MSNEENKINNNIMNKYKNDDNDIILEKNSEESDKDESKDSEENNELDKKVEDDRQKYLNNPETFRRKRDFFSFYSKKRNSEIIPQKAAFSRRITRIASQVVKQKPEFKRFSKFELKPRGFGVNKMKERIEFFEKKNLEDKYKTLNLTHYQKTYYDNNELRKFDNNLFKIENIQSISVSNNKVSERKKSYNISEQNISNNKQNISNDNKNNKDIERKKNYNISEQNVPNDNKNKISERKKNYNISEKNNFSNDSTNENNKDNERKKNYNISEQKFSNDSTNKNNDSERKKNYNISELNISNDNNYKNDEKKISYSISEQNISNDNKNKNDEQKISYKNSEQNLSNDSDKNNNKVSENKISFNIFKQDFSFNSNNENKKLNEKKIIYNISEQHFSCDSNNKNKVNEKKQSDKKLNLNLVVDYSKILNSSKITKKEKELDLFMPKNIENEKKSKKNNEDIDDSDDSDDSLNSSKEEVSTNLSHGLDKPILNHIRQKSELCYYKDILNKISTPVNNSNLTMNKDDSNFYRSKGSNKNNKYILVKKNDNKISLEKQTKFKNGIKKVLAENISDNMTLKKLDNAKYKLNQSNNNKNNKRQIFEMLELLVVDNINKSTNNQVKINNLYDRKKLIRAFEIMPQLSIINQKIKTYLQNINISSEIKKEKYNEKEIKQSVSSIYLLECFGLEPIILFNGKNKLEKKKFINDLGEDIQLTGINNKKKYIKYYFQNLYKANFFLEILISNISKLQETVNISK